VWSNLQTQRVMHSVRLAIKPDAMHFTSEFDKLCEQQSLQRPLASAMLFANDDKSADGSGVAVAQAQVQVPDFARLA